MTSDECSTDSMTASTAGWDARTTEAGHLPSQRTESRRVGHVVLASGRRITVDHGQDFAGLIRA